MGDLVGCLFQRNSGYQIVFFCILYLSLCVVLFPSINRVMVKLKKSEKIFGNFGDFWLKSVPRGPKHSDKKSRKIPGFQFQKSRDFGWLKIPGSRDSRDPARACPPPSDQTRLDRICLKLRNVFSQIVKCICLILTTEFVLYWQNVFVPSGKMYLFQIAKCICSKLQNVFVSSCKLCLNCKFSVFSSVHSILYIWYLSKLVNDQFY